MATKRIISHNTDAEDEKVDLMEKIKTAIGNTEALWEQIKEVQRQIKDHEERISNLESDAEDNL